MEKNCKYWNAEHEDCALSYAEIEANVIDKFAEKLCTDVESFVAEVNGIKADLLTLDYFHEFVCEIAEQMKVGAE